MTMILLELVKWIFAPKQKPVPPKMPKLFLPTRFDYLIYPAADLHRVRPTLLKALFWHESQFQTHAVGDGGRARGIGQMHELAAVDVGVNFDNLFDEKVAIPAAAAYLGNQYKRFGTDIKALMAYNQGPTVAANGNPQDAAYALGIKYAGDVLTIERQANG